MNFFTRILLIGIAFSLDCADAKSTAPAPQPAAPIPQPQPQRPLPQRPQAPQPIAPQAIAPRPLPQRPIAQESYKDLVAYVKNASKVWDAAHAKLRTDFITTLVQKARAARLDDFQIKALLQTARDVHGVFSGNKKKDIDILQAVDHQINAALRQR